MSDGRKRIAVALDASERSRILDLARLVGPEVGVLKVGLEAFCAHGPELVREVAAIAPVFLDLKLHDIPNTVGGAAAAAARTGASILNVHAGGGLEMMRAAGERAREAAAVIQGLMERGRVPVVVGGTFFWVKALFEGLSSIPPASDDARKSVMEDLARLGSREMHSALAQVDPITAARLTPGDSQRISRALEVYRTTGVPLSEYHRNPPVAGVRAPVLRLILSTERDVLYARINRRLAAMIEAGLVDEVSAVLAKGFPRTCRPLRSSSFVPVIEYLDGLIGVEEMASRIAQGHRNYAKRQLTWLRRETGTLIQAGDINAAIASAGQFLGR